MLMLICENHSETFKNVWYPYVDIYSPNGEPFPVQREIDVTNGEADLLHGRPD